MKRCPECGRDYVDETLNFCLDDGIELLYAATEPATAILSTVPSESATRTLEQTPTPQSSSEHILSNRKSITVVICILLIAVFGIVGYLYYRPGASRQIESIAVMPFVNESGNPDVEYLSDGMTETLIASLAQLPKLNVKARSSVFRYKGKGTDTQTIGKELNVQAVLNGRVVQRGQDLILNVELIDAQTENVLWTENYSRKMVNLVSLQSDLARDLSQKLRTKLSRTDEQKLTKSYTDNAEAYDLYLQGRSYWNKRTRRNVEISVGFFQRAIDVDPNFALAYAGLAEAYAQPSQQPQGMPRAREAALNALGLDQDLAEAHLALGRVLASYDHNFAGAEREYLRAIEINPNLASAHLRYGDFLNFSGKFEAAERELRRALELEPLSPSINTAFGSMLINSRRYDEAITHLKKTVELDGDFWLARANLARAYQLKGNYQASIEELARVAELNDNPQRAAGIRDSFERGGWEGYLRFAIKESEIEGDRRGFYVAARPYAELGEKDKAFAALNSAYQNRESEMLPIKVDPLLDPLRDDPRFQELLKKMGFPE
jgi:TolB-like protein/Tfp pilus assembly protein PilF